MDESSNPWCGAARPRGPTPENSLRLKTWVCPTSLSLWEQGEGTEEQFGGGYARSGLCTVTAASVQPLLIPKGTASPGLSRALLHPSLRGKHSSEAGMVPVCPLAQLDSSHQELTPLCPCTTLLSPIQHGNRAANTSQIPFGWLAAGVHLHTVPLLLFSNNIHLSWRKGQRYHHLRLWKDKKILLYSMLPLAFYTYPPSC